MFVQGLLKCMPGCAVSQLSHLSTSIPWYMTIRYADNLIAALYCYFVAAIAFP